MIGRTPDQVIPWARDEVPVPRVHAGRSCLGHRPGPGGVSAAAAGPRRQGGVTYELLDWLTGRQPQSHPGCQPIERCRVIASGLARTPLLSLGLITPRVIIAEGGYAMGRYRIGARGRLLAGLLLVVGMVSTAQPAGAITGGQRDEVHTNVGVVRFTTESGRFRCSGTLISPTVVLTAGHCTGDTAESPATDVYVSFNTDLPLDPLAPGITATESAARAANYITGTAHPDPGWDGKLSLSKQHDQGVVVLDLPAASEWSGITPAPLLPIGTLDCNQGALKKETFTLVGPAVPA